MRPPCEVVVKYMLPKFRAMVAEELVEKHGMTQMTAASKLGMTQAAVSYYLSSKRGFKAEKFSKDPNCKSAVSEAAALLSEEEAPSARVVELFCKCCKTLKSKCDLCEFVTEK